MSIDYDNTFTFGIDKNLYIFGIYNNLYIWHLHTALHYQVDLYYYRS